MLHKFDLHKAFKISAWILKFIKNCRKNKKSDPLTTAELVNQKKIYIKREQKKVLRSSRFEDNEKRLNLEKNDEGVYICKTSRVLSCLLTARFSVGKKVIFAEYKR